MDAHTFRIFIRCLYGHDDSPVLGVLGNLDRFGWELGENRRAVVYVDHSNLDLGNRNE